MFVNKPVCPRCECDLLERSRRRWFEKPLSWLGWYPFRCQDCGRRFYVVSTN